MMNLERLRGRQSSEEVCPIREPDFLSVSPDVDECKRFFPEVCKNGVCVNNIPGYNCYCSNGYVYNSTLLECVGTSARRHVREPFEEELLSFCVTGQRRTGGSPRCHTSLSPVSSCTLPAAQ